MSFLTFQISLHRHHRDAPDLLEAGFRAHPPMGSCTCKLTPECLSISRLNRTFRFTTVTSANPASSIPLRYRSSDTTVKERDIFLLASRYI